MSHCLAIHIHTQIPTVVNSHAMFAMCPHCFRNTEERHNSQLYYGTRHMNLHAQVRFLTMPWDMHEVFHKHILHEEGCHRSLMVPLREVYLLVGYKHLYGLSAVPTMPAWWSNIVIYIPVWLDGKVYSAVIITILPYENFTLLFIQIWL